MGVTPALVIDLVELFQKQFGSKPYVIPGVSSTTSDSTTPYNIQAKASKAEIEVTLTGSKIREQYRGVEIFLPIRIFNGSELLMYLPYCVVRINVKKNIVKTPMIERQGSVKEEFNTDDYVINIKGFLIGEDRKFPEKELLLLKKLFDSKGSIILDNALTNIFLTEKGAPVDEQRRVVIESFDLPEVQGGREHVRPFTMQLLSDTIFTLEFE